MKPEDVMRALEFCASPEYLCEQCPIDQKKKDDCICGQFLAKNALTLLREKDAEIKRLNLLCTLCPARGHSYAKGWNDAITEFADRIIRFYNALPGKTVGGSVEYHVKQVRDAMLKETEVTS